MVFNGQDSEIPTCFLGFQKDFLRLIHITKSGSYNARNVGFRLANHEHLLFMDFDIFFDAENFEKFIKNSIDIFTTSDEEFAIAPAINQAIIGNPSIWARYDKAFGLPQTHYFQNGFLLTACLAIPKKTFLKCGEFADVSSGGDFLFSMRLQTNGIHMHINRNCMASHHTRATLRELIVKNERIADGILTNFGLTLIGKFTKIFGNLGKFRNKRSLSNPIFPLIHIFLQAHSIFIVLRDFAKRKSSTKSDLN